MNKYKFCKLKFGDFAKVCAFGIIFFSLFAVLGQNATAQIGGSGVIVAIDEVREGSGKAKESANTKFKNKTQTFPTEKKTSSKTVKTSVRAKKTQTAAVNSKSKIPSKMETRSSKKYDGIIIGDKFSFLNFEVVEPVQPLYTIKAKEAAASGLVQVEILVGENGTVLTAKARTGNSLLHAEAEKAALAMVLNKPAFNGSPARAVGFLVYRFGKVEDE